MDAERPRARAITSRAGRGVRNATSLKIGWSNATRERDPLLRVARRGPCTSRRARAAPAGRARQSVTSPPSASSVWFVVMFDVAFSRRMCCSRVCSVSTKPRSPFEVGRLADDPARAAADELRRARRGSRSAGRRSAGSCRAPGPRRSPCRSRRRRAPRARRARSRSTCATASAPASRAAAASAGASSRQPKKFGCWKITAAASSAAAASARRVGRRRPRAATSTTSSPKPRRVGLHDLRAPAG